MRHSLLCGTNFGSVENGMIHSRSLLILHSSAEQSKEEKSNVEECIDGKDSTVGHMDQRMDFSLVERKC